MTFFDFNKGIKDINLKNILSKKDDFEREELLNDLIEELKEDQLIIEKSLNIYLSKDQKQHGPFSMNQLKEHIADGAFDENDLSCHDGKNWVSVSETLKLGS